ncbi:MAG: molybdenum cofactor biosynthesis protein MoaE [Elusimicrobiota bacterium]
MKLPLCPLSVADKIKRIVNDPLNLDDLMPQVFHREKGAVVTFSGTIRDTEEGKAIRGIFYEAYAEMAEKELEKIIFKTQDNLNVLVEIKHKVGWVKVGEASLLVACAGVHRKEAFLACAEVVDQIKQNVPIWKARFDFL